ncbi:MAG: hypothetical protein HQM10_26790 [Candidatus Riflebacteria bacterium]|nr:hypothetical protein [Candidatus Riflebacteria bacterium]
MKKIIALLLLLFIFTNSAFCSDAIIKWRHGLDEEGIETRIGERYPLPTQNVPFSYFIATQTIDVGTSTAVAIGTLATYTRSILVGAYDSQVNFGNSTIPAATYPFHIDAETYVEFDVATRTPALYFRGATASTSVYILEK